MTGPLSLLVAAVVGVLGVARLTRLITSDAYPPMARLRDRWKVLTGVWVTDEETGDKELVDGPWTPLLTCPFCASPYLTALALAAAIVADVWEPDLASLTGWWWVLAVWAAAAYGASMIVVRDEPPPVVVQVEDEE